MKFYDFSAKKMNGQEVKMEEFKGKVVLVVNTASKCGLTPQFTELEELNKKYKEEGLEILGFPCNQFANQDKGSNEEIQEFCSLNYGVTFNMFQKIDVNGENAHPLYKFLKNEKKGLFSKEIKWNFTKFLIDSEGNVVKRYAPTVKPLKIENNHVEVDRTMRTNIEGCYAAGDIVGAPYQYIKAAGEGNIAALSAVSYIEQIKRKKIV